MQALLHDKTVLRWIGYLCMPILTLLVSGCSRTEFAYRNADWFIEAYARKTVAAQEEQIESWRPTLEQSLEYHRLELLPLVIGYLDLLARTSQRSPDSQLTKCVVDAGIYLYERHARLAVELAGPLLAEIEPSQVRHLSAYLEKDLEKKRKQYLKAKPREQHQARVDRFMERTEQWTGKLDDSQREIVAQAVRQIPDLTANWLDYRTQQTQALLAILQSDPADTQVRNQLTAWWVSFDQRSTEYTREWQLAKQGFSQFLQQLGSSLSARQQQRIRKRLTALREDLAVFQTQQPERLPDRLLCLHKTGRKALPSPNSEGLHSSASLSHRRVDQPAG
jgi:hypothetical protein